MARRRVGEHQHDGKFRRSGMEGIGGVIGGLVSRRIGHELKGQALLSFLKLRLEIESIPSPRLTTIPCTYLSTSLAAHSYDQPS